jgi:hypothetical protein
MRKAAVFVSVGASYLLLFGVLVLLVLSLTSALADGWKLRASAAATAERSPSFSPDGTRIGFIRKSGSAEPELWVMDADGSDQLRLARATRFSWARGGRSLVFARDGRVYRVGAEGGNAVRARAAIGRSVRRWHGRSVLVRDGHVVLRDGDGREWQLT